MEYHVPHDDYKTFRRKRFIQLLGTQEYVDGATDYCLLLPFAEERHLNTSQKLWLCYLYGLSYSETTTMRFFTEFPSLREVNPVNLKAFWKANKDSLWFNPDKKYIKNNDQVIPAIGSLCKLCKGYKGDIEAYLVPILQQGFDTAYKEIQKNWKYFGPHGAYLFFDALYGLCPELYSDPTNLDWKNCGKTVVEGMAHLLYRDECIESGDHDLDYYNKIVNKLCEKTGRPKVIIESTLCAFRKLFKQTRYAGYYADRALEECYSTEKYLKALKIDIWAYRRQVIPEEFRGEDNNWKGIRKDLCKLFMETGNLTNT